jgi:outer membrane protein
VWVGARLLNIKQSDFDFDLALSLPARSSDVPARRGMPDLRTLVEFGPRLKIKLAEPTQDSRLGLELPLRAVIEARGGLRRQDQRTRAPRDGRHAGNGAIKNPANQ